MRRNLLGLLIAGAFASTAHAGLLMNLTGGGGPIIDADALDEAPTSFLAQGANTAILNFASTGGTCVAVNCSFQVLTQAVVTGYKPSGGGAFIGLPSFPGQITMLASYTETVVGFSNGAFPTAQFVSTGAGQVQFFYNPAGNVTDLTGSGFNAGTLIGTLNGVTAGAFGSFTVTSTTPVELDGANPDEYTGQKTVSGTGSQTTIDAGTTGVNLDPNFFLTTIMGFAINFTNISIGLPYTSVQPADCFNPLQAVAVGTSGLSSTCDTAHVNGLYSAQSTPAGAYVPNVGAVNGFNLGSPDFIAQTDFNSAVEGVPEPGSLALVGLALASLGYAGARRRRV